MTLWRASEAERVMPLVGFAAFLELEGGVRHNGLPAHY